MGGGERVAHDTDVYQNDRYDLDGDHRCTGTRFKSKKDTKSSLHLTLPLLLSIEGVSHYVLLESFYH